MGTMRKAPCGITFAFLLLVVIIGGPVLYISRSAGEGGAAATLSPDAGVAAADAFPTPSPLPTLVDAIPIATETPRLVTEPPSAEIETDPAPAEVVSLSSTEAPAEVPSLFSTEAPVESGGAMPPAAFPAGPPEEDEDVPIVMIDPVRQEDMGAYPNVRIPAEPVGSSELYVAHGDIYGTGRCFVHVFRPGDRVTGLAAATWRLVRISSGAPEQREDLVQRIQLAAEWDPAAGGSCPFG